MIYYVFENKLYRVDKDVVQFFSTWNQMWWNSYISKSLLIESGKKLL